MIDYKFIVKNINKPRGGEIITEQAVFIVQQLNINNTKFNIPHPLTAYVQGKSKNINSQRQKAAVICGLLNYIQRQIYEENDDFMDLEGKGIYNLNFNHAVGYLNYCSQEKKNKTETIKLKETIILEFYDYLIKKGLLGEDIKLEKENYYDIEGRLKERIKSPFKEPEYWVQYPEEKINKLSKLKNMDTNTWRMFIEVAQRHYPELAFGLYIQFMAGLRVGEVVNLTIDAVSINERTEEMYLDIDDRQNILFQGKDVDLRGSQVKRPRANQIVLNLFGELIPLYKNHLKIINQIKVKNNKEKERALFVSAKGEPLTGENYKYYFYRIKEEFLEELQYKSYETYKYVSNCKWGTHIGRGVFTNFIIAKGLCDLPDGQILERFVADLRGDRGTTAAKDYIDQYMLIRTINDKINNLKLECETSIKLI